MSNGLKVFWAKSSVHGKKICNLLSNDGLFIVFVAPFSNEQIFVPLQERSESNNIIGR